MTATEILTLIGELTCTEIDGVNDVRYEKASDNDELSTFTVSLDDGKRFTLSIAES